MSDPYDNLYETTFGGDGEPVTRKLTRDDLPPETIARLEAQLDEGITLSCDWRGTLERRERGERAFPVTAIHVRRPRVRDPLAEIIARHVTETEITLTADLGEGQLVYKIRRVSRDADADE